MKKLLSIMIGVGLILSTVSSSFAKGTAARKHKKSKKSGGHKGGARNGTAK